MGYPPVTYQEFCHLVGACGTFMESDNLYRCNMCYKAEGMIYIPVWISMVSRMKLDFFRQDSRPQIYIINGGTS